jgi:aspartyl-tRNA(Asn)/glutamyl-tRNA(Gln) amidotransferase subunit A
VKSHLSSLGYTFEEVDLPHFGDALAVYYILMPAEVSSNMARYDGVKYGSNIEGGNLIEGYFKTRGGLLGKEVKRRILLGTYVLSAGYADQYYAKAWQVRNLIKKDFEKAFEKVDVIAIPTSPTPTFKIGEKSEDPLQMYLADIFTVFANLVGVPAISIPDGFVKREEKDLPTGLQLVAPHCQEKRLFNIGKIF